MQTVQDLLLNELFESDGSQPNEMLDTLKFMRESGTPLTDAQVSAMFLLNEVGCGDVAAYAAEMAKTRTSTKKYFKMIDKFTLADRIKGSANLKHVLKASVSNPNSNVPSSELQPQAMRQSELR